MRISTRDQGSAPSLRSRMEDRDSFDFTVSAGNAYNGIAPLPTSVRKVEITDTPDGGRKLRILEDKRQPLFEKIIKARNQVVFPIAKRLPMPKEHVQ